LGATIIEKHFTLDKGMEGPDHELSLDPASFEQMVKQIRDVESGLGDGRKRPRKLESESRATMRRGLKTTRPIGCGDRLTSDNVKIARPATGIEPHNYDLVMGHTVETSLNKNDSITWDNLLR
jgi:sialic acid synthase SpsE